MNSWVQEAGTELSQFTRLVKIHTNQASDPTNTCLLAWLEIKTTATRELCGCRGKRRQTQANNQSPRPEGGFITEPPSHKPLNRLIPRTGKVVQTSKLPPELEGRAELQVSYAFARSSRRTQTPAPGTNKRGGES